MTESNLGTQPMVIKANSEIPFDGIGNFIMLLDSTGINGDLKAKLGNSGRWSRFNQYDKLSMPKDGEFKLFWLQNNSGADITATVGLGNGNMEVAGAVTVANAITISKATTLTSTADVALNNAAITTVKAANTARREIIVTAHSANTVNIRIGDGSTVAGQGIELQPGQAIVLTTTAAVSAFAGSAGQKVTVLEVAD